MQSDNLYWHGKQLGLSDLCSLGKISQSDRHCGSRSGLHSACIPAADTNELVVIDMNTVLSLLYFILPVYIANMTVVFIYFRYTKDLSGGIFTPVDFNLKFGKDRLPVLGSHQRWDSPFVYTVVAILSTWILWALEPYLNISPLFHHSFTLTTLLGFLLGLGSWLGALAKTFIKRRLHMRPHSVLPVFDQVDHVVGALACAYVITRMPFMDMAEIVVLTIPLVIAVNYCSFKMHIKDVWW